MFVIKYIFGYGCVLVDSYKVLLVVEIFLKELFECDFLFFKVLVKFVIWVMSVYVIYIVIDFENCVIVLFIII